MEKPKLPQGFDGPFEYDIAGGKWIIKPYGALNVTMRNLPPMPSDLADCVLYALNKTYSTMKKVKEAAEKYYPDGKF